MLEPVFGCNGNRADGNVIVPGLEGGDFYSFGHSYQMFGLLNNKDEVDARLRAAGCEDNLWFCM